MSPVFELFKDTPALARHLFKTLGTYGIRLADLKLDPRGESLGEINLRILSWTEQDAARLFLDHVEVIFSYMPLIDLEGGNLIPDLLDAVSSYSSDISFRAFAVSQEVHGVLDSKSYDFLARFSSAAPERFGAPLSSGVVFYYGASEKILAGSVTLDLSRFIDGGVFFKLTTMYDASQVEPADLVEAARGDFLSIMDEVGLDFKKD